MSASPYSRPREVRLSLERAIELGELRVELLARPFVAAPHRVVGVAEPVVEALQPQPPERPLGRVGRPQRRLRVALLEVLHDHLGLRQHEPLVLLVDRNAAESRSSRRARPAGRRGRSRPPRSRAPSRRARCARGRRTGSGRRCRASARPEPTRARRPRGRAPRRAAAKSSAARRQLVGRGGGARDGPDRRRLGAGEARDDRRVRAESHHVAGRQRPRSTPAPTGTRRRRCRAREHVAHDHAVVEGDRADDRRGRVRELGGEPLAGLAVAVEQLVRGRRPSRCAARRPAARRSRRSRGRYLSTCGPHGVEVVALDVQRGVRLASLGAGDARSARSARVSRCAHSVKPSRCQTRVPTSLRVATSSVRCSIPCSRARSPNSASSALVTPCRRRSGTT